MSVIRSLLLLMGLSLIGFATNARSQDVEAVEPAARPTATFSRLALFPGGLDFPVLRFPAAQRSESRQLIIENSGNATLTALTVGTISGRNAPAFNLGSSSSINVGPLAPRAKATVTVNFEPLTEGASIATLAIVSSATKGRADINVPLHGIARGIIPPTPTATATGPTPTATATATMIATPIATPTKTATPTATMTAVRTATATGTTAPTATATATSTSAATSTATATASSTSTATATSTASPTATGTPGAVITDKNSANAPGVTISGTTVTVTLPFGSDVNSTHNAEQAVIESTASPLPTPTLITTDRVNSCTPAKSGEVVCSGQGGTIDLIPVGATTSTIITPPGPIADINYDDGDCMGCGAMVDDMLNLGIIATGNGFFPLNLANNTLGTVIPTNSANSDEAIGVNFGYDMANGHHRILSANYTANPAMGFATSPAHFQIIDLTTPATPVTYELANDQAFFLQPSHTCSNGMGGTAVPSDNMPETTAIDTSTNIVYVTFHTPAACQLNPVNDIALFDMNQATFTKGGTAATTTWTSAGMTIQTLTGISNLNGVDPISVEPTNHLAIVSGGNQPFGVLQLPSTSGTGTPAISDWVSASMPNDPGGAVWNGWPEPNGLATYVSPNTSKPIGVMMNSGTGVGPTYLAIVDLNALLHATRDGTDNHKIDGTINLVTAGIVRFVKVQ